MRYVLTNRCIRGLVYSIMALDVVGVLYDDR